jgi:hypothetical protein
VVSAVAILERLEPIGFRWTPTATVPETYRGRHRRTGRRRLSVLALLYVAAHAYATTQVGYLPRHAFAASQPVRYVPRHRRLG